MQAMVFICNVLAAAIHETIQLKWTVVGTLSFIRVAASSEKSCSDDAFVGLDNLPALSNTSSC